ncbi:PREDICTED: uncharacterized protein LOC108764976 [Trachymyrmex cornetzi]|uniref:uncharacterized protein LOC108764976 n=1 Tax=Trachymyrmex cornetzi TaxID=471704 RepID=UPI00084F7AFE|nr:PREDICTED: uncharacterized protein LOC108764976 [Trachymyrmex cornetzi]
MADNNRGVSVVSLPPPPSPPPPPPPPSLPSPPLLAIVLALRTRRAVVSGAHRVHMYTTYLSPFSEINKQCRGHSCRAPTEKVVSVFDVPSSPSLITRLFSNPHRYRRSSSRCRCVVLTGKFGYTRLHPEPHVERQSAKVFRKWTAFRVIVEGWLFQ